MFSQKDKATQDTDTLAGQFSDLCDRHANSMPDFSLSRQTVRPPNGAEVFIDQPTDSDL